MVRSHRQASGENRGDRDYKEALKSSLLELKSHMFHIETGNNLAARTMAVVLRRVLERELPQVARGRSFSLRSFLTDSGSEDQQYPLTINQVTKHGTRIMPVPLSGWSGKFLPFKEWRRELVYREGAGWPSSYSSKVAGSRSLSRESFLTVMRNEVGAHFGDEKSTEFLAFHTKFTPL